MVLLPCLCCCERAHQLTVLMHLEPADTMTKVGEEYTKVFRSRGGILEARERTAGGMGLRMTGQRGGNALQACGFHCQRDR